MAKAEQLIKGLYTDDVDAMKSITKNLEVSFFGIIQKVMDDTSVLVSPSVIPSKGEYFAFPCVLASFAGASLAVDVVPKEGDRVAVFSPKYFDSDMFDLESRDTFVREGVFGYSCMCGIAVLLNKYQTAYHNNHIVVDSGTVIMELAYDEENSSEDEKIHNYKHSINADGSSDEYQSYDKDNSMYHFTRIVSADGSSAECQSYDGDNSKYHFTRTVSADGDLHIENDKVSVDATKDGDVTLVNEKVTIEAKNDGNFSLSNGKCNLTIDDSGNVTIETDGKFSFKNKSGKNLFTILDKVLQVLNQSYKTFGSPANHQCVPSQLQAEQMDLQALME